MSLRRTSQAFAVILFVFHAGPALAQDAASGMEVQLPDGQSVVLYDDHTWEFKRPAPQTMADTVEVDELVERPSRFDGQDVIVTGTVVRALGAYRLQSSSRQTTIVLDVERARRADQIALEQALAKAGFGKSVRVQAHGKVEKSLTTSRLRATDLVVVEE
jgi:hypothetical protein